MNVTLVIGFIIVILCLFSLLNLSSNQNRTVLQTAMDGQKYQVLDLDDKDQAANNMAVIRNRLNSLVSYLKKTQPSDPRVIRLAKNYRDNVIREAPKDSKLPSYTINKGESIHLCLRQKDNAKALVDINTLTFVAIHELGHVVSTSYDHTPEFWKNFAYLLEGAIKIGVYTFQDFKGSPVEYCGKTIADSPYKRQ